MRRSVLATPGGVHAPLRSAHEYCYGILDPMYRALFASAIDPPWTKMAPLPIGRVPSGQGTPDTFVTVEHDGVPFLRVDVYGCRGPFSALSVWQSWLVIGWGDVAH